MYSGKPEEAILTESQANKVRDNIERMIQENPKALANVLLDLMIHRIGTNVILVKLLERINVGSDMDINCTIYDCVGREFGSLLDGT